MDMNSRSTVLSFLLLLFFAFPTLSLSDSLNLIVNGDFEDQAYHDDLNVVKHTGNISEGWTIKRSSNPAGPKQMLFTDQPDNSDLYVRLIANDSPSWSGVMHTSSSNVWEDRHRYRFSMQLRVSGTDGADEAPADGAHGFINIRGADRETVDGVEVITYTQALNHRFELEDYDNNWKTLEFEFVVPEGKEIIIGQFITVYPYIVGLGTSTTLNVDFDDVVLESIHDMAMYPLTNQMMIATDMSVPNWFKSVEDGTARKLATPSYYLELPQDVVLEKVGSHPLINTIGVAPPTYSIDPPEGTQVLRNGENYTRYKLLPSYSEMNAGDQWVGPVYLSTTGADGSSSKLYYQTTWTEGETLVSSEVRPLDLEFRDFPDVGKPEILVSSLAWIRLAEQLYWPDYLSTMDQLGFNTISANRYALKCPSTMPYTCVDVNESIYATSEAQTFINDAVTQGFFKLQVDSPLSPLLTDSRSWVDANLLPDPVSKAPSPCYRGETYQAELAKPYTLGSSFLPDLLFYDLEFYLKGAELALTSDVHCDDPITGDPITEAGLLLEGTEIAADLNNAWGDGVTNLPLRGFYGVSPGSTPADNYSLIFDYEPMLAEGTIDIGQRQYYWMSPQVSGDDMRRRLAEVGAGHKMIPWIDPGSVANEYVPAQIYDRALEMYGSGAYGISWFAFKGTEGSDLYYYAKAMEAVLPVEEIIVNASAVTVTDIDLPANVKVTGITDTNEIILLVSSYGPRDGGYSGVVSTGSVTVQLPEALSIHPVNLATGTSAGAMTNNSNQVTFNFTPGVAGSRTNLVYLCDPLLHSCTDEDIDGLNGYEDNCPLDFNPDQINSDTDDFGDACDAFPTDSSEYLDSDGDRIGNNADADDDNDGALDIDDCNKLDASIYPGADEVPYDGIDQDCNGSDLTDVDLDTYDYLLDCNDNDASIYPGADEQYNDAVIQNCDNTTDPVITIYKSVYTPRKNTIEVEVNTSLGKSDVLTVDGNIMDWSKKQAGRWTIKYSVDTDPGTVLIRGSQGYINQVLQ